MAEAELDTKCVPASLDEALLACHLLECTEETTRTILNELIVRIEDGEACKYDPSIGGPWVVIINPKQYHILKSAPMAWRRGLDFTVEVSIKRAYMIATLFESSSDEVGLLTKSLREAFKTHHARLHKTIGDILCMVRDMDYTSIYDNGSSLTRAAIVPQHFYVVKITEEQLKTLDRSANSAIYEKYGFDGTTVISKRNFWFAMYTDRPNITWYKAHVREFVEHYMLL